jgi:hypothetical protein
MSKSVLEGLRFGDVLKEFQEELERLCDAVSAKDGKGAIMLKITVSPEEKDSSVLIFEDEIAVKMPSSGGRSFCYRDKIGHLTTDDPNQMQLSLEAVQGGAK